MQDMGLVGFREPFARLFTQGMIHKDGAKMSKSKGNTVDPLALVDRYGADAVRMFTLFLGPAEQDMEWHDSGIEGVCAVPRTGCGASCSSRRDKPRVDEPRPARWRGRRTQTIAKVTDDIDRRFAFNTPIAAVMELVNEIAPRPGRPGRALRRRDGGLADPAVRAARRRGAVGAARRRAALGDAWPVADRRMLERDTSRSSCR